MEEKELTPNEIRGIGLIVKALQKKYNFIQGWNVDDDDMKYVSKQTTLFCNDDFFADVGMTTFH